MADFFTRFGRSVELVQESGKILRSDSELLVLPLLSGLASLIVIGTFGYGVWQSGLLPAGDQVQPETLPWQLYVALFVFYFVQYAIIIFFNTALVGAAIAKLSGGEVTVGSALALAVSRIWLILGYALISATIGVLLRYIGERLGFVGRIIEGTLGVAWTVATFLVVPVLAAEGMNPIAAIERSIEMLNDTWGENIIGGVGISVATGLLGAAIILIGGAGGMAAINAGLTGLGIALFAGGIVALIALTLVSAALSGIYAGAVYCFALTGTPPAGFDANTIRGAFARKGAE